MILTAFLPYPALVSHLPMMAFLESDWPLAYCCGIGWISHLVCSNLLKSGEEGDGDHKSFLSICDVFSH